MAVPIVAPTGVEVQLKNGINAEEEPRGQSVCTLTTLSRAVGRAWCHKKAQAE
jgi:hypothetical protein